MTEERSFPSYADLANRMAGSHSSLQNYFDSKRQHQSTFDRLYAPGEDYSLPIDQRVTESPEIDLSQVASLDRHIPSHNKGFKLLQKMGWKEGTGLGRRSQGRLEPVRADINDCRMGLGKEAEINEMTELATAQRKLLDIEMELTPEAMKKREEEHEKRVQIENEIKETIDIFLCKICNKQYKLAIEYEAHLSSYDHHHTKRFAEMKAALKETDHEKAKRDDRIRKEKEREDRELAKLLSHANKASKGASNSDDAGQNVTQQPPVPPMPPMPPMPSLSIPPLPVGSGFQSISHFPLSSSTPASPRPPEPFVEVQPVPSTTNNPTSQTSTFTSAPAPSTAAAPMKLGFSLKAGGAPKPGGFALKPKPIVASSSGAFGGADEEEDAPEKAPMYKSRKYGANKLQNDQD